MGSILIHHELLAFQGNVQITGIRFDCMKLNLTSLKTCGDGECEAWHNIAMLRAGAGVTARLRRPFPSASPDSQVWFDDGIACFGWEHSTWEQVCVDFGNRKCNRVACGEPQEGRILHLVQGAQG